VPVGVLTAPGTVPVYSLWTDLSSHYHIGINVAVEKKTVLDCWRSMAAHGTGTGTAGTALHRSCPPVLERPRNLPPAQPVPVCS
jgi:hypothetical protein